MVKSADAFRTIREVSDILSTPAHVLRFWETKFSQIKPLKRAGGRRYYRRSDVNLIAGIKKLLHSDGVTIRGVQKILREQGVRYVGAIETPPYSEIGETDNSSKIKIQAFEALAIFDEGKTSANLAKTTTETTTASDEASQDIMQEEHTAKPKKSNGIGTQISLFDDLPLSESLSAKPAKSHKTLPQINSDVASQLGESDQTNLRTDDDIVPEIAAQLAQHTDSPQNNQQIGSAAPLTTKAEADGDVSTVAAISGPLHYLSEVDDLRPLQQEQLPKLRDMLSAIFHSEE